MSSARRLWLRALAILPLAAALPAFAQDPRASVVVSASREWLALVDRPDITASYSRAGEKFRSAMTVKEWGAAHEKERKPRGAFVQRALYQTRFDTKAPGAPLAGEYAFLVYRTSFASNPDARETITLERESDGVWRVVGYSIR